MKTRATRRALVVALVVAAGCSDPTDSPLPAFSVSPATQWSGGAITVRSQYFINRQQLPVVLAGGDTVGVTRQDDSTLRAMLPRGPSGPVTLTLARGSRRDSLATVQRVGYSGKRTLTPALYGELLTTDSAGAPIVLGGSFTGSGNREPVVRLNVVTGHAQVLALRQPSNTQYGMAPSSIPGAFTVRDSTDSLRLATLLVDTPSVTRIPWGGTGFTRQVSLLSPGLWLMTTSHQSFTRYDTATTGVMVATESPWAVYMSPRGDRTTLATAVAQTAGNGVPVFDNATGTVAYVLPFLSTEVATFSPDGATLYAAGAVYNQYASDTLAAVDATSGALLLPKVGLPEGFNAMGIAFRSGGGGQLLVGATKTSAFGPLVLLVYQASTLELLGILPTADDCGELPATGPCFTGVVAVDDAHDTAYIVIPGSPTPIWAFDLLSTP